MRENPPPLRKPTPPAARASWMTLAGGVVMTRGLIIAAIAGVFLAAVGAFGTGELPILPRLAYWVGLAVFGGLVAGPIARPLQIEVRRTERPWLWGAIMAVGLSIPFTVVVWVVTGLVFFDRVRLTDLPGYFPSVLLITAAITGLNFLVNPRAPTAPAAPGEDAPPRFLERLPFKLRGAELWAVEAEDHYLRLHTSKGQDLILFRLADAVAELEGLEGARTHRSWWVARGAISDVRRGDGRATLTLPDGVEVPVSRAHARGLREAGWF